MGTHEAEIFNVEVGKLLRGAAAEADMSVLRLSKLTEIERNTLTRYLKGERAIPMPVLYRVSETVGVAPEGIITAATARVRAKQQAPR